MYVVVFAEVYFVGKKTLLCILFLGSVAGAVILKVMLTVIGIVYRALHFVVEVPGYGVLAACEVGGGIVYGVVGLAQQHSICTIC